MTVWKRRELEGHQELQRGNYRTRSLQQPVSSPKREIIEEKCETIHEESEASNRDVASETKYEESQASKGEIAKQLEGVLNKDVNQYKSKRPVRMSHSHPDLSLTQPIRTAQTEKDPALNAHAKELRGAVGQRREK